MQPNTRFDGLKQNSTSEDVVPTDFSAFPTPAVYSENLSSQEILGSQDVEALSQKYEETPEELEENRSFNFGTLAYTGILSLLLLALIGVPIWYLLNQEDRSQVAGVSENKTVQTTSTSNNTTNDNEPSETDEVYVYDPNTQTFNKKQGDSKTATVTQGGGSVNLNPAAPVNGTSFAEAFARARAQLGDGATFEWNGQLYSTDFRSNEPSGVEEVYPENIYSTQNPTAKFVNDANGKLLAINECNLNLKYPAYTENGAMVDFDRIDAVDEVPPYWTFYAFTGYQSPTEKFGVGYTVFVQCFNLASLGEKAATYQIGDSVNPEELFKKTGWFIADNSITNLKMSRNENLVHGYSITFTRAGQLYSMNFMSKQKDSDDQIGGLYSYQIQMQFQDTVEASM